MKLKSFIVIIMTTVSLPLFAQDEPILSFKEWQEARIKEAQTILIKTQIDRAESIAKDNNKVTVNDVQQAKINVEIAKELGAPDYFVLYIIPKSKDNKNAILMAAQTMSKMEIADILTAYQAAIEEKKRAVNGPEKAPAGEFSQRNQGDFFTNLFGNSSQTRN